MGDFDSGLDTTPPPSKKKELENIEIDVEELVMKNYQWL